MNLTDTQLSELRRNLDQRHASLLEEVRDELEKSENQQYVELLGRTPGDIADESVADALADLNLGIVDRHILEIRDIEAARARIQAGSFGTCIACGTEIEFERLLAYPTAKRCLACQQHRERTYAHQPTPKL
ncbi:MAG TPA: TraR/DksA family transcriptional regulator [Burkholderiales bacterium]|nr:TraR/DksA family transcriptional regulator [Burkholderiales bacterium]